MEASNIFQDLLRTIEESNLNYSLRKTPFSAIISLKSSFVNRFNKIDNYKNRVLLPDISEEAKKIGVIEEENLKLKAKLKELDEEKDQTENNWKKVNKEMTRLEDKLREEKRKVKSLDEQIVTFRKEVLDIKSEKKSLSSKLKSLELEATAAGVQLVNMTQENEKLKELLKKETKTVEQKNYDIKSVLNEKDSLKERLEVTLSELSTARIKREKEQIKVKEEKKQCTLCTLEFDAYSDLKNHLRTSHVKNKETQTFMTALSERKFEQYTCFYCDKMIISEQVLEAHKIACHGAFLSDSLCNVCGFKCKDYSDLRWHNTVFHGPFATKK